MIARLAAIILLVFPVAAGAATTDTPARNYFTDVPLVNQEGKTMRFYTDVLQGRTVVIESFFADCTSVCPVMNSTLRKVQSALAERVGKDILLVSITVNPVIDTPARLKSYAKHVGARPGWIFLTGNRNNVEQALHKLGLATDLPDQHKNVMLVGNEPTGYWKKVFGLGKADDIINIIRGVADDKR